MRAYSGTRVGVGVDVGESVLGVVTAATVVGVGVGAAVGTPGGSGVGGTPFVKLRSAALTSTVFGSLFLVH